MYGQNKIMLKMNSRWWLLGFVNIHYFRIVWWKLMTKNVCLIKLNSSGLTYYKIYIIRNYISIGHTKVNEEISVATRYSHTPYASSCINHSWMPECWMPDEVNVI